MKRRDVLKSAGLLIGFSLGGPLGALTGQTPRPSDAERPRDAAQVDSFLAIAPDGSVTIYTSKVDVGTGMRIAIAQMAVAATLRATSPAARSQVARSQAARSQASQSPARQSTGRSHGSKGPALPRRDDRPAYAATPPACGRCRRHRVRYVRESRRRRGIAPLAARLRPRPRRNEDN